MVATAKRNEEAVQGARKREQGLPIWTVHFSLPDVASTAEDGREIVEGPSNCNNSRLRTLRHARMNNTC